MPPLPLLVFVVGTGSLGAEIAAVRLLAPYFGASTVVWANTIGVVLVALSVGYWLGGRLADRHPHMRGLCLLALAAAGLLALVPFAADPLLDLAVDALDEVSAGAFAGSLIAVLVLVAVPVLLLGAVSPYALRLAVASVEEAGTVAGRLYALSTAGSLVGTLVSALLFIPLIGTRRTFLVFALAIAVVAVWGLRPVRRYALAPAAIAVLIALPVGTLKASTGDGRVIHEAETAYQYARVIERDDGSRALEEFFPRGRVDGVEIDAEPSEIGRRRTDARYDQISLDTYRQPYIPFHLTTVEFFETVRDRLRPGGALIVNVGHPEGEDDLENVLSATIGEAFAHVVRDPIEPTNTLIVASQSPLRPARLRRVAERLPAALRPTALAAATRVEPALRGGEAFTDDRAPVEWLVDQSIVDYAAGGED